MPNYREFSHSSYCCFSILVGLYGTTVVSCHVCCIYIALYNIKYYSCDTLIPFVTFFLFLHFDSILPLHQRRCQHYHYDYCPYNFINTTITIIIPPSLSMTISTSLFCTLIIILSICSLTFSRFILNIFRIFLVVMDWNSTTAIPQRKNLTFFVPCYFLAFPPFRSSSGLRTDTLSVIDVVNGAGVTTSTCPPAYYATIPGVDVKMIEGEKEMK